MLNNQKPFSKEKLEVIFRAEDNRLLNRESETIEYKLNFNFGSLAKYLKTMCGYANNRGGYLIFGIENQSQEIIGMANDQFEKIDPEKITGFLNECFSSKIEWAMQNFELNRKKIGVIYTFENLLKPVICKVDKQDILFNGEIYYRYNGRTDKIEAGDLQNIIEQRIVIERQSWQEMLAKMAKLTPISASLVDLQNTNIEEDGNILVFDEDTIEKVKFLKEGEFDEVSGAPAIRVLTEGSVSQGIPVEKKVWQTLNSDDIVLGILKDNINNSEAYIKQIDQDTKKVLPIWYFLYKANISSYENAVIYLEEVLSHSGIHLLRDELQKHSRLGNVLDEISDVITDIAYIDDKAEEILTERNLHMYGSRTIKRTLCYNILMTAPDSLLNDVNEFDKMTAKEVDFVFESITHIPGEEISDSLDIFKKLLLHIKTELNGRINSDTNFRHSICYIDGIYYKPLVLGEA